MILRAECEIAGQSRPRVGAGKVNDTRVAERLPIRRGQRDDLHLRGNPNLAIRWNDDFQLGCRP